MCNCSYCKTIYNYIGNEILTTEQNNIEPQSTSPQIHNNFVYPTETLIFNDTSTSENIMIEPKEELTETDEELPDLVDENGNIYSTDIKIVDDLFNGLIDYIDKSLTKHLSNCNPIIKFIYTNPDYISALDFGEDIIDVFDSSVDIDVSIIETFMQNKETYIDIYNDYITRFKLYLHYDMSDENYNLTENEKEILLNENNRLIKWTEILKQEWIE